MSPRDANVFSYFRNHNMMYSFLFIINIQSESI